MMTEDEAKTKWCPFVRAGEGDEPAQNREYRSDNPEYSRCIGSACMAFRWVPDLSLSLGEVRAAIISPEDAPLLDLPWWWDGRYAKGEGHIYLHRAVVERAIGTIPAGMFVDHIDGDPLNNRRGNLRVVTKEQNAANAAARGGVSRFRGVHQSKGGRWSAQISKGGVRLCLGTFDAEEQAAAAYDEAAERIHGEFARLNLTQVENSGRQGYCGLAGRPE